MKECAKHLTMNSKLTKKFKKVLTVFIKPLCERVFSKIQDERVPMSWNVVYTKSVLAQRIQGIHPCG